MNKKLILSTIFGILVNPVMSMQETNQQQNIVNNNDSEIAKNFCCEITKLKDMSSSEKLNKIFTEILESNENDKQYANKLFLKCFIYTCMQNCLTDYIYSKISNIAFSARILTKNFNSRQKYLHYHQDLKKLQYNYRKLSIYKNSYKEYLTKLDNLLYQDKKFITYREAKEFVQNNEGLFVDAEKQYFNYVQNLLNEMIDKLSKGCKMNCKEMFNNLLPNSNFNNKDLNKYSDQYELIRELFVTVSDFITDEFNRLFNKIRDDKYKSIINNYVIELKLNEQIIKYYYEFRNEIDEDELYKILGKVLLNYHGNKQKIDTIFKNNIKNFTNIIQNQNELLDSVEKKLDSTEKKIINYLLNNKSSDPIYNSNNINNNVSLEFKKKQKLERACDIFLKLFKEYKYSYYINGEEVSLNKDDKLIKKLKNDGADNKTIKFNIFNVPQNLNLREMVKKLKQITESMPSISIHNYIDTSSIASIDTLKQYLMQIAQIVKLSFSEYTAINFNVYLNKKIYHFQNSTNSDYAKEYNANMINKIINSIDLKNNSNLKNNINLKNNVNLEDNVNSKNDINLRDNAINYEGLNFDLVHKAKNIAEIIKNNNLIYYSYDYQYDYNSTDDFIKNLINYSNNCTIKDNKEHNVQNYDFDNFFENLNKLDSNLTFLNKNGNKLNYRVTFISNENDLKEYFMRIAKISLAATEYKNLYLRVQLIIRETNKYDAIFFIESCSKDNVQKEINIIKEEYKKYFNNESYNNINNNNFNLNNNMHNFGFNNFNYQNQNNMINFSNMSNTSNNMSNMFNTSNMLNMLNMLNILSNMNNMNNMSNINNVNNNTFNNSFNNMNFIQNNMLNNNSVVNTFVSNFAKMLNFK